MENLGPADSGAGIGPAYSAEALTGDMCLRNDASGRFLLGQNGALALAVGTDVARLSLMDHTPLPLVQRLETAVYRIPTDSPESDGTATWDNTDLIVVRVDAGGIVGLGWTYAAAAAGGIVNDLLAPHVVGRSPADIEGAWQAMARAVRNAGRPGVCATAISAVDVALWDLKARLLGLPLVDLLGAVRQAVPIYGSGGFTSYDLSQLKAQLGGWASQEIRSVKMKIGREPAADPTRVAAAREAIGDGCQLFVDANGAYTRKQALAMAEQFAGEAEVTWFEEPVSSDDLEGLRLLRDRMPGTIDVAAGEYGYTPGYFRRMLQAGAVDCLQADATRCGGFTGFLKTAALCEAFHVPLSAHCAPQLHAHVGCCAEAVRHIEYFYDHARISDLLFEGALKPIEGSLTPDRSKPGHGISLNQAAASTFAL